ncbi:MAG: cell envelope integrity protein TolA [Bacteroidia bacterium]|tara:strand:- start:158 stop:1513 length:1356 start_codon:yes stop_codon:yes gene_type:complete
MMTFIGIALILVGIGLYILKQYNDRAREKNNTIRAFNEKTIEAKDYKELNAVLDIPVKWWLSVTMGVLFIFLGVANPFSINDAGQRTVVQPIQGELWTQFGPGLYFSGFFSKKTVWPNNFTIQVSREGNRSPDADLWVISNSKDGTFSEGDNAELEHTVKWDLPSREAMMLDLHITYNRFENLMSTTLLSYQKKIASFSTQRMSSEAHYSGGKSQLDQYFQDQLRNGQVLLQTNTKTRVLEDGSQETYIDVKPKLDENGEMVRVESDIQTFGILSTYTSIDNVHYVEEIDVKLRQKIKYAADKANSKQELIAAQQEEQTAIVKGRKLIAERTATEEADEIESVIRARKAKLVAAEKLEEDKYKAASTLALKKAEAEGDKLKVLAGLSPLEQARIDKETAIGVAKALAGPKGIVFPKIVVSGGDSKGGGNGALQTVQLKMLNDLAKSMATKK